MAAALAIAVEVRLPSVMGSRIVHVAHLGGLAAGLVLTAATTRGTALADLARTPSRLATVLAGGLGAVFAGGVAWGVASIDWAALG